MARKSAVAKTTTSRRARPAPVDPLVPIVGERVKHALREAIRGEPISINSAAAILRERGVRISGPALNDIVLGVTHSTRRSVRDQIAQVAGWPFSDNPGWLSGERDELLDASLEATDPETHPIPTPLAYNVEAERLARDVQLALSRDVATYHPDLGPSDVEGRDALDYRQIARVLLSLPWWRRQWLGENWHEGFRVDDAEVFAQNMAGAIGAFLAPWTRDGVAMPLERTADMFLQISHLLGEIQSRAESRAEPARAPKQQRINAPARPAKKSSAKTRKR